MSGPPFVVLHVCMGNICRSPMAERLMAHAVRERVGDRVEEFVLSESAGTGGWHAGDGMNPPAARELRRRGVLDDGFRARKLLAAHIDTADLILTATSDQREYAGGLRPDARARIFVLGEFGRLVRSIDKTDLPSRRDDASIGDPRAVYARGVAIVGAVNAVRDHAESEPGDDLEDPWGREDAFYRKTAEEIEVSTTAFVDLLFPKPSR